MGFYENMEKTMERENNLSVTENGAIGYRSTGRALLDLNFSVSSMRNMTEEEIVESFRKAWEEDRELALRWLFFLRDVRNGMGERRSFRIIMHWLGEKYPKIATTLLINRGAGNEYLIPFYGRWDDIFELFDLFPNIVINIVSNQIDEDLAHLSRNEGVSLLAKWMPSNNTSSREKVELANRLAIGMRLTPRMYRKNMVALRKHIDVVETKMSGGYWDEINYESVPSKANLRYKAAFAKHDPERRQAFLEKLATGEAKINASTSYPYEIFHSMKEIIRCQSWTREHPEVMTLEGMWKSILEGLEIDENIIVVADGSGSMEQTISKQTEASAYDVAQALAIFFATVIRGQFHGKYITFSENPRLVDVGKYDNLVDQMQETFRHREVANTNIMAVFRLILRTAVDNHMTQEDMPGSILIISDMEFDGCATNDYDEPLMNNLSGSTTLFDEIRTEYEHQGYKLPRLVFWTINSRTKTIPVKENELGVALLSGYSINNVNMILSGDTDPYLCLVNELKDKRYDPVIEAVGDVLNE